MSSITVDVHAPGGEKAGTAELPGEIFDVQTNIPLIHQVVVAQLAAARQGTHSTKTRGEVRGGGSKPWRQKGTGRARHGSRRSPIWTGGGTVHGPKPRDYSQRTPKKMIVAALRGSLSDRARDGQVFVVSELVSGEVPSTRTALETLEQLGELKKVLVVLDRFEEVAWLSLRNVPTIHVLAVDQLNAYDVLVADSVVFTSAALAAFTHRGAEAVASESEATEPAGSAEALENEEEK
ncbi:50S ribosomal protein L4 [Arachnia propionica]|uniref:50S ribosomal protein L4 n=1 Tax=Arachnia propionica TaxID=1750 RepID=UPI00242FDAE2|nr:50S ribosomal protein L4 [Arachnia propionica]